MSYLEHSAKHLPIPGLGGNWLWEPILRYPKPSLGSHSYAQELCKCFAMSLPPHASPMGIDQQGAVWMETSPCRNYSSALSSQPKGGSVCTATLPGLCLAGWFGFPPPLAREEHSPDTESGLAQSHRHGWMPRHGWPPAPMHRKSGAQTSSVTGHVR